MYRGHQTGRLHQSLKTISTARQGSCSPQPYTLATSPMYGRFEWQCTQVGWWIFKKRHRHMEIHGDERNFGYGQFKSLQIVSRSSSLWSTRRDKDIYGLHKWHCCYPDKKVCVGPDVKFCQFISWILVMSAPKALVKHPTNKRCHFQSTIFS